MPGDFIGFNVKDLFFDREKVRRAVGVATARALSRLGAMVRTSARSRMRKRKSPSPPGQPPSVHAGQLKDLLYFSYEADNQTVVIGPVRFKIGQAPNLNEFGGNVLRQRKKKGKVVQVRAVYPPRPFMGPALKANLEKIPAQWRDSVKGN